MGVKAILDDLERAHIGLQHLRIEATESNVSIILDALTTMKKAHSVLSIVEEKPETDTTEKVGEENA